MKSTKSIVLSLIFAGCSFIASAVQPIENNQPTQNGNTSNNQVVEKVKEVEKETKTVVTDLIATAKKYLGIKYRSGGKTPAGFDCSGFTGYVFKQHGYKLSATSSAQFGDGKPVNKSDIKPGDLLFFNGRQIGSRIGHVAIAISEPDENGVVTFIHSAVTGGIRIDKTSEAYYKCRYKGARRVIL